MTGPEHYREAERLLAGTPVTAADVEEGIGPPSGIWPASDYEVSCAHVHAVLALAAASAALLDIGVAVDQFSAGWSEAIRG